MGERVDSVLGRPSEKEYDTSRGLYNTALLDILNSEGSPVGSYKQPEFDESAYKPVEWWETIDPTKGTFGHSERAMQNRKIAEAKQAALRKRAMDKFNADRQRLSDAQGYLSNEQSYGLNERINPLKVAQQKAQTEATVRSNELGAEFDRPNAVSDLASKRLNQKAAQLRLAYMKETDPIKKAKLEQELLKLEAQTQQAKYKAENPMASSKSSLGTARMIDVDTGEVDDEGKVITEKVFARPVQNNGRIVGWDTGSAKGRITPDQVVKADQLPSNRTLSSNRYRIYTGENEFVDIEGVYDRNKGTYVITDSELTGGESVPITELQKKYRIVRPTSSQLGSEVVGRKAFDKTYLQPIKEGEQAVRSLLRFEDAILGTNAGARGVLESATGKFKALIDETGAVSPEEISQLVASDKAQSIVGQLREEVVGGGVMTEQDAQRVLMAFGGDPTGFFANPQKTLTLVRQIMEDKYMNLKANYDKYNNVAENNARDLYSFTDPRIGEWYYTYEPTESFDNKRDYEKAGEDLNPSSSPSPSKTTSDGMTIDELMDLYQ